MCLKSITRVIENPTLDELVGYKAVFIRDNRVNAAYFGLTMDNNELPVNEWLQAVPHETKTDQFDYVIYQTGFHIFTSQNEAHKWGDVHASHIIQVKYRLVTYHGTEYSDETVHIAREMYIPWPQTPVEIK